MQEHLIADIGKAVIAAAAVGLPSYFLRIPLILAYLFAGILIGPHLGFSFIQNSESIAHISEIGLVLLMFILGLEINLKKLIQTGKAVLLSGSVQIAGCVLIAYIAFLFFGYRSSDYTLLYISVACALSSTLVVVKILADNMDLDSLPSRITLGILVIQDIFAIGFLALQPNLSDLNFLALLISISKVGLLVAISWSFAHYVLPHVFKKASRQPELMLILAMAWCFAICGVADYLGLSLEMGALVSGISIAVYPYHFDIAAKISSLRDFFITLFFVSLGLQIPMPNADVIKLAILLVGFILLSRLITIYPLLHRLGYANRSSLLPAINLSQLSEFSLVFAAIGVSLNHISQDTLSSFIIALVLTALISSYLIPGAHRVYKKINPFLEKIGFHDHISAHAKKADSEQVDMSPSIVMLGFYQEASSLLYELQNRFPKEIVDRILVIDFNPEAHQQLKKMSIQCKYGDVSHVDTLRSLNLHKAQIIISTIPDKILKGTTNLKLLKQLKNIAPESTLITTAETITSAREMYNEGAHYVYIPRIIGATYLIDVIERLQMSGPLAIVGDAQKFLKNRNEVIS